MVIVGSYGLGLFGRGMLLISLAGATGSTTDAGSRNVAAMNREPVISTLPVPLMERRALRTDKRDVVDVHGEPVVAPLPVPLMERRALRTNGVSGSIERQQPHGQRRQRHPSNDGDDMSSSIRLTPSSSSKSMLEESLSTSSSLRHPLCQQVEISESNLSGSESTRSSNPIKNVIDGDQSTRWATEGFASWLMVDLPEPTLLAGVAIDFGHKSTEPSNSQSFTLMVFGDYQVIHLPEVNAGRMGGLEYVEFEREIPARSVVLVGYGREGYTSLVEIQLCGGRVETALTSALAVKKKESVSSPPDGDDHRSSNRRTSKHLRGGSRL